MRGGMQCINMKYASGRAIVMQHCHEMVQKMQVNAIRSLLQFHWSDLVKCNPSVCFSKYGNKTSRKFIGVSSSISHHWLFICYWGKWKEMRLEIEKYTISTFLIWKKYFLLFHLFSWKRKKHQEFHPQCAHCSLWHRRCVLFIKSLAVFLCSLSWRGWCYVSLIRMVPLRSLVLF